MTRVLLIDNYDSFSYNLVQAFRVLGAEVIVRRNDTHSLASLMDTKPTHLVLSPGPGTPDDAGCCIPLLLETLGQLPLLGVCLGHQCLAQALGGKVVQAPKGMHGKTSQIHHDGEGLFRDCPQPMEVGRYHSLIAAPAELPQSLNITASTSDDQIMAIAHQRFHAYGLQFHPESILTPEGPKVLRNFLQHTGGLR